MVRLRALDFFSLSDSRFRIHFHVASTGTWLITKYSISVAKSRKSGDLGGKSNRCLQGNQLGTLNINIDLPKSCLKKISKSVPLKSGRIYGTFRKRDGDPSFSYLETTLIEPQLKNQRIHLRTWSVRDPSPQVRFMSTRSMRLRC
ncbi:hypothetical protein AVEN_142207-1 [Araneus ventricosus]|uniref:Uncharacterized protein n=1 Tax=Araneus ventricosus TaxID=182803 RepID=A0A4Y2SP53_ARAVE|nr:hypothetical protein AVEN_142207-1 [Araneus ventricosus]